MVGYIWLSKDIPCKITFYRLREQLSKSDSGYNPPLMSNKKAPNITVWGFSNLNR
jgi:hypothetical protein